MDTDGHGPARDRALRRPGPHGCRQPGSESPGGPRAPPVAQAVLGGSDEAELVPRPAVPPQGPRLPGGGLLARPGPLSIALSGAAALLTQKPRGFGLVHVARRVDALAQELSPQHTKC